MMLPKHRLNPQASDPNPWKYVEKWLNLDLKTIQRLGDNSRAALRSSIQTYARTMTGADDLTVHALPHDRLRQILRQHGRLLATKPP